MTRKSLTVRTAVALVALLGVALLGAHALEVQPLQREIPDLPLVRMDPVVILADRAESAKVESTQIAKTPVSTASIPR